MYVELVLVKYNGVIMKKHIFFSAMILTCGATYLNACVLSLDEQKKILEKEEKRNEGIFKWRVEGKNMSQVYDSITKDLDEAAQGYREAQKFLQDLSVKIEEVQSLEDAKSILDSVAGKICGLKFLARGGIGFYGLSQRIHDLKKYGVKLIPDQKEQKEMLSKIEILELAYNVLYGEIEKLETQAEKKAKELNVPFSTNINAWD